MKKLLALKKWLTLPEAAKHLTIVLGEDVCVADVLQLALDRHLKLSFNFVNHVKARKGKVISIEDASYSEMLPFFFNKLPRELSVDGKSVLVMKGIQLDDKSVLELEDQVISLEGVFELAMLGPEYQDVNHLYQMQTGGPPVTLDGLAGALVIGDDGVMYQLQESFENNQFHKGSQAQRREIDNLIATKRISPLMEKEVLEKYQVARERFLENVNTNRDLGRDSDNYYPAGGLPSDGVIVVRTDALRAFEQSMSDESKNEGRPLKTSERTTLLTIIAALCDYSAIDLKARGVAKEIEGMTAELGALVTDDTIRKVLAQIPDAIDRRTKK